MSIRLSPDGLSFWTGDHAECDGEHTVAISSVAYSGETEFDFYPGHGPGENIIRSIFVYRGNNVFFGDAERTIVYLDSPKTILIPEDIFRPEGIEEYLSIHNMRIEEGEQADITKPFGATIAIIVSAHEALRYLGEELGEFSVASPLQYTITDANYKVSGNYVMIYLGRRYAYISILNASGEAERKILFSDTVPVVSEADLAYYLTCFSGKFTLKGVPVFIKGYKSKETASVLNKYFDNIRCE